MNFYETIQNITQFPEVAKPVLIKFGIFLLFVLLSFLLGRYTPFFVSLVLRQFFPQQITLVYEKLIDPIRNLFKIAGTFIFISLSLKTGTLKYCKKNCALLSELRSLILATLGAR